MAEMVKCRINGQFEIILPKHRADRPEWYTDKGWEKERMQNMYGRIDKGDIVLYIGNEEGDLSAVIASWGAQMILVEPNPLVWPNSKAIWEANELPAPIACFVGFASDTNSEQVQIHKGSFPECADGEVIHDHGFMELRNRNAQQVKIDTLVNTLHVKPKHISIDVEGSEGCVLRGAEKTLLEHKPIIWLSGHPEFVREQYGEYLGDLRNWIKERGYREHLLAYDHECHFMYIPL